METQTKSTKKIIEKLLKGTLLTKKEFEFLKQNPGKFSNIKFVKNNN